MDIDKGNPDLPKYKLQLFMNKSRGLKQDVHLKQDKTPPKRRYTKFQAPNKQDNFAERETYFFKKKKKKDVTCL